MGKTEPKTENKKDYRKRWKKTNKVFLTAQFATSIVAAFVVAASKLLPSTYMLAVVILLSCLFFASFILLSLSLRQRNKEAVKKKRAAGKVIAFLTTIGCIFAIFVVVRVMQTMDGMHEDTKQTKIGVYVLTEDAAKELADAKDYTFGYTESYDYDNTKVTFDDIEKQLSQEIAKQNFDTAMEMVDGLYDKQVGAIVLNEAYVNVLEDIKEYSSFSDKVRLIYEFNIEEKVSEKAKGDITKEPFVVYVSGSDTRDTKLSTSRSDVNILAVVNPTTKQVLLLNTPRDYYVDISVAPGNMDKLTHCGIYGIDCSMDTLGKLYGVEVNYYSQINFTGIIKLVDAVGGITVESDRDFKTSRAASIDRKKYEFVKGENELNGEQALAFARERKKLADGDLGRGIHQMAVIKGIMNKVQSPAILTDWSAILSSVEGMFATDLTQGEMSSLVNLQLDEGGAWNIKSYGVTGKGQNNYTYSMPKRKLYTMIPNEQEVAQAKLLIQKVMKGETLTDEDLAKQN